VRRRADAQGARPLLTVGVESQAELAFAGLHQLLRPVIGALAQQPESQRQALEYGVKFAGCTVHFVDENLDAGPIVLQATVPVRDDDTEETLASRILTEEHRIYTEAVRIVLEGKYKIVGRRVIRTN